MAKKIPPPQRAFRKGLFRASGSASVFARQVAGVWMAFVFYSTTGTVPAQAETLSVSVQAAEAPSSGFLGHATVGNIRLPLLTVTGAASAMGAVAGAWLMTEKLKPKQVKRIIGIALLGIAAKMIRDLIII